MKTLVLGASTNPERYSNKAILSLQKHHHEIFAIGNKLGVVNGVVIHTNEMPIKDLHTITLYLNAKNQEPYYDYILKLQPQRIIFNPGAENEELKKLATAQNINCLDACTLVLLSIGSF